ncbi:MAG: hypothetical protein A2700_00620 [Candidatus Blackburnbacteria bacterium RIFCSPHIGHO2_01_FULL_44_64]|uniref:Glycosyltransferase RgtA/B/C/D-like domain-containing protein n=1 Tax=Candidatus Blackburnbacteria bacterium RIFCSPHIGHO2_02_FULL_44_20 TaxID=1797516 RepID=A0A1G1V5X9_9BACT|nr:MAG: hypothetical protein A2700_00620 [Candidatus Blackburnbacteria bacterium RIFCSPHIGHO2_01_FULL_44_64]OGY10818.1 MAG: hypothetical protein A3D26_01520 [Candidatus Blackburnbacteria bacterium RIFCSPHIGHO2_02_FULL_44_20]OGY10830.1 MAG: hypothetical protein A3E16_04035 [Candidatus Blackburnbacteria bacterium RIFCSPHIGHO2_12_FULL_44_25]OGY15145.1 MAG: hypothetical protein A3A62_03145 [Candidatus Blackburnbacteria bacterium RIFCSPLOWO2_01_FULL_44_43]OGY16393.1 MAG: hypothetical protein A3H88_0
MITYIRRFDLKLDGLLVLILFLAGFLRFYNLNWDQGNFFHPDERNIAAAVSRIDFFENLNPQFFAYGGFSIYLARVVGELLRLTTNHSGWVSDWGKIDLVSRFVSALASLFTVLTTFFLAKNLFDKKTGLLAAFLITFFPTLIQSAHFGVTESLITLLVTLIALVSLKLSDRFSWRLVFFLAVLLGVGLSTKTSALSFYLFPIVVLLFRSKRLGASRVFLSIYSLLVLSILTFFVFSPYSFLDWQKFRESMLYESGVVVGRLKVVYVLQFENTYPYFFQVKNFFWQIGPVFFLSLVGLFYAVYRVVFYRQLKLLAFLLFPVFYFLYVGSWYAKFIRYMVPIIPFLAVLGAFALREGVRANKRFGLGVALVFLVLTAFGGLSFFSIYTRPQTRIAASEWIYDNISPGARILQEHWDDGLPVPMGGLRTPEVYSIEQLAIYDADNQQKALYYSERLAEGDYVVISSRRLYGTLINLPHPYPLTSRYYKLLFQGDLGYKKISEFSSYPGFLGITINDDGSEETFQVYDHPKVIIFENSRHYRAEQILARLTQ